MDTDEWIEMYTQEFELFNILNISTLLFCLKYNILGYILSTE